MRQKLIKKFDNTPEQADAIVRGLRRLATLVALTGQSGWVPSDPEDDKFIEAAVVGNAHLIVSGDRHLLEFGSLEGITILTPRQFLERLAKAE